MAGNSADRAHRQVQRLYKFEAVGTMSDAELLDRFVSRLDETAEAAFEELVIRHGPMVLRICRSLLHDAHDAEDAFQAVFLVLANRAGSIRRRGSVASWLFGVAHRVVTRAHRSATRRRVFNQLVAAQTSESYLPSENDLDWEILHEEILRLPERHRAPVVLCYLQGLTYAEAARQLGLSEVAIQGRLARTREHLRQRLVRRGVTVPAGLLAAGAASQAQAAIPLTLTLGTIRIALGFMAGNTAAVLARGVLNSMILNQCRVATLLLCFGLGSSYWAWHAFAATVDGNARNDPGQETVQAPASAPKSPTTPSALIPGLTGLVRVEGTGEPVAGATIQVLIGGTGQNYRAASRTAWSRADGRFVLDLPVGSARAWMLTAPAGYWAPYDPQMFESFTVTSDGPVHRKDYVVRRGTVWDFRITRAREAKPIPGVVWVSSEGNSFLSVVDDAGRVRLTLPTEEGQIKANAKESLTASSDWVPLTLEWKSGFRPDAAASVTNEGGSPARYLLKDSNGKTAILSGTNKGRAEPRLDGGKLVVEVTLPEPDPKAFGDLTGRVVDTSSQPVAGASVSLVQGGENGGSMMSVEDGHHALTNAQGHFRLRSIPRADSTGKPVFVLLSVRKEGFVGVDTKLARFKSGGGNEPQVAETVTLAPGVSLSGTVVGPDGKPLAGAWVEPSGLYADRAKFTKTDDLGRFTVRDLPTGMVKFRFNYGTLAIEDRYYAVRDAEPLTIKLQPVPGAAPSPPRSDTVKAARDRTEPLALGTPAQEWETGAWSDGRSRKLADYRGKVVVLCFWGTGCDPSLGVLLSLEKPRAKYRPLGAVFLTLHTPGENEKTFRKVLEAKGALLTFAIDGDRKRDEDLDQNGTTSERYGVQSYPTLVMIDRRGNVAFHSGRVGDEEGMAAMEALGKKTGFEVDKSTLSEVNAYRLLDAYFDREIETVLHRP